MMMSIVNTPVAPNTLKAMYMFNSQLFRNEEVRLSTNTMLIGTNGVGKTTTLSLLTFFSTGKQQLFKQDKNQSKSFYDYFFSMNNSFIVYEYEKEEHNVLIAVYAKEGIDKLELHFIALEKDSYNVSDIFNRDTREAVLNRIDEVSISSMVVPISKYLRILYGDSSREDKIYMFSHVANYKTYANLLYASFRNIAIDSTSIKNILLEYAYSKEGMENGGVNLERYSDAISTFQFDYSAIMEWKKNYHSIDLLRVGLGEISIQKARRITTLQKIIREWEWYIELLHGLGISLDEKKNEQNVFLEHRYPESKYDYGKKKKDASQEISTLAYRVKTLLEKNNNYNKDKELFVMINELPKLEIYKSELRKAKSILATLEESSKSIGEGHRLKLEELELNYNATVLANNTFLSEQTAEILAKKLAETNSVSEQIEKAKKEFSIEAMNSEFFEKNKALGEFSIEKKKLELEVFSDESRIKAIKEHEYDMIRLDADLSKAKINEEQLMKSSEAFEERQGKAKEELRLSSDKAFKALDDELQSLNELHLSSDTLYSKIISANLDIKKYTSILKMEVLKSSDFILTSESSGRQIFDFSLSEDTELIDAGETLYQKKKNIENQRKDLRDGLKTAYETLEKERTRYFSEYRKKWQSVKLKKEEIDASKKKHSESIVTIKEELVSTEKVWKNKQDILNKTLDVKILEYNTTSSKLTSEITRIINALSRAEESIKSNLYDEKESLNTANSLCETRNKESKNKHETDVALEKETYTNLLSGTEGVDVAEIEKYSKDINLYQDKIQAIHQWGKTIDEYEAFIVDEWIFYKGLDAELSQKRESFRKIEGEINTKLQALENEKNTLDKELLGLEEKNKLLKKHSGRLNVCREQYETILEGVHSLPSKTESEKLEANFEEDADTLIDSITSSSLRLSEEEAKLTKLMARKWGTFVAKGVLLFYSSPFENAQKIVSADNADEMGVFADKAFQGINLSINAVSDNHGILQGAYGEVKSAISKINKDLEDIGMTKLIKSIQLRQVEKHSGINQSMKILSEYWKLHSDNMQQNLFSNDNSNVHRDKILELLSDFVEKLDGLSGKEKIISVGSLFDLQGKIEEKGNVSVWENGALGKGSDGTRVLIKVAITASLFSIALGGSKDKQIPLLLLDEIGKLHNDNVQKILNYVNSKNAYLVAVQPNNAMAKYFGKAYFFKEVSETQSEIIEYLRRKVPLKMKETLVHETVHPHS